MQKSATDPQPYTQGIARAARSVTHLEILRDFTHQPLERKLPDQKLCRLLVPANLSESDGTRAETMRLLNTSSSSLEHDI